MNILRERYFEILKSIKDVDFIKIITGIRRCGKSKILEYFRDYLISKNENVIYIDFESKENIKLLDREKLEQLIDSKITKDQINYILLDEIQEVKDFEKLILGYYNDKNNNIYLTGSNSHMLSKQISSLFTGRDLQIEILPLSFKEYSFFSKEEKKLNLKDNFQEYFDFGGFPGLLNAPEAFKETIVNSIINSIIDRDIIPFFKIKNKNLLVKILQYVYQNIAEEFSSQSIKDYLISNKISKTISINTIETYMNCLFDSYLAFKVKRYDCKGKKILKTLYKCYCADLSLRHHYLGIDNVLDKGKQLENLVYLELKRRYTKINVGYFNFFDSATKTSQIKSVDFICSNGKDIVFYQVSDDITNEKTYKREMEIFYKISGGSKILINNCDINKTIGDVKIVDVKD
jgi:predicted AAA+ superfamily ATPase